MIESINTRVARVKGWCTTTPKNGVIYGVDPVSQLCSDWSGSIADAWELVPDDQVVLLIQGVGSESGWACDINGVQAEAETAPLAICKAYLACKERDDG